MSTFRTESGIEFLARVKNSKQTLRNIDNVLFDEGLKEGDVVGLSAESNRLKNAMLMHLLKKATLSEGCGGAGSSVLYIDTAFTFRIDRFTAFLMRHVDSAADVAGGKGDDDDARKKCVEKSLENLIFIRCYDSQQLLVTFQTLRGALSSNTNIKLLVVDDVGSNYWQDFCSGGFKRMDLYETKVVNVLQNSVKDFKVNILYVRPEFFAQKNPLFNANATYGVRLSKKGLKTEVTVRKKCSSYTRSFITTPNEDIVWS